MTINDSNWQFLHDATGLSLPFNEMYFRYLGDPGYTGTLQDRIAKSGLGLNPSGLKNPANEGGGFNLDAFMAAQTDGLYFDTTKADRFFQESWGSALADDVGEAIGLALSHRAWNGQTLAQVVAAATERFVGGASNDNSTAPSTSSESPAGQFNLTSDGATAARRDLPLTTVIGQAYLVSFTNSGAVTSRVGSSVGGTQNLADTVYSGSQSFYFVATATTTYLRWWLAAVATRTVTAISIKAVPGKHGVQATGTLKPTRQTTGAKFDGSDDNWLTPYLAGASENFIVALVDVPASIAATQIVCGAVGAAGANPTRLGLSTDGTVRAGLGATAVITGTTDLRGTMATIGLSFDGSSYRLFANDQAENTGVQSAPPITTTAFRIGASNNDGTAANFFGGSVKKLVAGREFLTLSRYRQIRSALLA